MIGESGQAGDYDDWVVIRSFTTPIEAHVVRSKLESEGIECFIRDEHLLSINNLYSIVLGGVRLCVRASRAAEAKAVLDEADVNNS